MKSIFNKIITLSIILIVSVSVVAQNATDNKSKELLNALSKVNGGWQKLAAKKDVQFTYVYKDYTKGTDISKERYIFNGESSWGEYQQHEVNVMPGTEGLVKQSLISGVPKITLDGKTITDQMAIGGTQFLRSVNFYWFTMMYKLNDPGTIYKYLGQETVNGIIYEKVSLTYNPEKVGKEVNDEYVLYFNPNTHLIDQFYFSLPSMGIKQPVMKMTLEYTTIDGIFVATKRKAFAPNEKGEYNLFIEFTTKEVEFNNGFKTSDLKI